MLAENATAILNGFSAPQLAISLSGKDNGPYLAVVTIEDEEFKFNAIAAHSFEVVCVSSQDNGLPQCRIG